MRTRNQVTTPTLYVDFESVAGFSDGSAGASSLNTNPAYIRTGSGSLKLTTDGLGTSSSFQTTETVNLDMSAIYRFRLWFYIEDITKTSGCKIRFSSVTDNSKYFEYSFTTGRRNGWNEYVVSRDDFTNFGGESWSNTMIRRRYTVSAKDANTIGTVYMDSLYINGYDRPKCVLIFDDISDTHYTVAYPYMRAYGMRGSLALVSKYPDTSGKMTTAQLNEMHSAGWDILNHTSQHVDMPATYGTDASAMANDIQVCKDLMISSGWTRNNEHKFFVAPLSSTNATLVTTLANMGFICGRSLYGRTQPNSTVDNPYLCCGNANDSGTTAAQIIAKIDLAIASGGTCILYFHIFRNPEDITTTLLPSIFQAVIDYLASKSNVIDVVPYTEWYYGISEGGGRKRDGIWA